MSAVNQPGEVASEPASSLVWRVRTAWLILRTCLHERLTYRGDFAFGTLMRFLPIVTQIFLWAAIYGATSNAATSSDAVAGSGGTAGSLKINSYTFADMVAYYLFTMVSRAFSSMPGLSNGIAREIRDGSVKKYLTQPIDMLGYLFWGRVAHKLVYYFVATGPFVLVFWLCGNYFQHTPTGLEIGAFIASLMMAFLIGFLLEALLGLVAFWFLEVSSLLFIFMMFNYFLSGHMVPLDWFPAPWGDLIRYTPFQYLAYFPAAIMLGKFAPQDLLMHLGVEVLWVLLLLSANRWAYARGVRRYSSYGG